MTCDNVQRCHKPEVIAEDQNAARVICTECKEIGIIRKDFRGVFLNRQYSSWYKRDVLQGNDNLFYKYYPQYLRQ